MSDNRTYGLSAIIILLLLVAGFVIGYKCANHNVEKHEKVVDTIVVVKWDTMKIVEPHEVERTIVRYDTLTKIQFVNITDEDLLRKLDSLNLAIQIPTEQAIYKDSVENAAYEAFVSGYKPVLDSIFIHCKETEKIITQIERIPARRISLGVQLGVGVSAQGWAVPYAGVGISYRLW